MSSFVRQPEHAIFYSQALLSQWSAAGARVINGADVLAIDANKARHLTLFRSLGLDIPATRVVHQRTDLARVASELRFPLMVKANVGGSGTNMLRYASLAELAERVGHTKCAMVATADTNGGARSASLNLSVDTRRWGSEVRYKSTARGRSSGLVVA